MEDSLEIFKGKNVLITGHTGFKGSWLAIWLQELGANIIGYALDPLSENDNFILSNVSKDIVDIRGDIRDFQRLEHTFKQYKPEIVFHLAAQPLVKYSYEHPRITYEVNVMGTMNVLEAIRLTEETKAGIIITSDKCYENQEWVWGYRENDPMGGYDPYSSSKGCCELLVSSYRNSFFPVGRFDEHRKIIASARAGNVIGGGDWSLDRIIPDCIRALESNKEIIVRNPRSIRPWQHALEPISGYLMLAARILNHGAPFSGPWNFGPESNSIIPVEEIVNKVIKLWGQGSWVTPNPDVLSSHEAKLLSLDISKVKKELSWHPRWDIEKTLEKTVEWYKNYQHANVHELCVNQIKEYISS